MFHVRSGLPTFAGRSRRTPDDAATPETTSRNQLAAGPGDVSNRVSKSIAAQLFQYDSVLAPGVVAEECRGGVDDAPGLRAHSPDPFAQVDVSTNNQVGIDDGDIRFVVTGLSDGGGCCGGLGNHQQAMLASNDGRESFANQHITVDKEHASCSPTRATDHLVSDRTGLILTASLEGRACDSALVPFTGWRHEDDDKKGPPA